MFVTIEKHFLSDLFKSIYVRLILLAMISLNFSVKKAQGNGKS